MSAKSHEESGSGVGVETMRPARRAIVEGEISDDELNVMIERAVEEAEFRLAGTPISRVQGDVAFISLVGEDEIEETVH